MSSFAKDPDEKKDYGFNWVPALNGDTIAGSTWVLPSGLTEATPAPSFDATTTTIWIEGGTAGENYKVTNRITTAAGRILEEQFTIRLLEA